MRREAIGDLLTAGGGYGTPKSNTPSWPAGQTTRCVPPWPSGYCCNAKQARRSDQQFDAALATADDGADAQNQRLAATLGKAVSIAETGKVEDAVAIQKVIHDADPEQKELQARAAIALAIVEFW